jgi:carbon-monoxide dehydrogenase small subunit
MNQPIELNVNGRKVTSASDGSQTLLDFLREDLDLTGTKRGCDHGDCGACTVLIDGKPVNSCLVLVSEVAGRDITTIEGLSRDGKLHPLQQAFWEEGAVQCGYCTPGMLLTAKALLDEVPEPDEEQVKRAISGNLCRCTGYGKIIRAIRSAADKVRKEQA